MKKCNLKNRTINWLIRKNIIIKTTKSYRGSKTSSEKNKKSTFFEIKTNYIKYIEQIKKEKNINYNTLKYAENLINGNIINLFNNRYGIDLPKNLLSNDNKPIKIVSYKPQYENNPLSFRKVIFNRSWFEDVEQLEDALLYNVETMKDINGRLLSLKYSQNEWNKLTVPEREKELNNPCI